MLNTEGIYKSHNFYMNEEEPVQKYNGTISHSL